MFITALANIFIAIASSQYHNNKLVIIFIILHIIYNCDILRQQYCYKHVCESCYENVLNAFKHAIKLHVLSDVKFEVIDQ